MVCVAQGQQRCVFRRNYSKCYAPDPEHYFSFSGKNERLYKALDTLAAENRDPRFNAFYRFINRHSHADSRNIRLQEEASADMYIDMFKRVFVMTEDLEHYDMMMTET